MAIVGSALGVLKEQIIHEAQVYSSKHQSTAPNAVWPTIPGPCYSPCHPGLLNGTPLNTEPLDQNFPRGFQRTWVSEVVVGLKVSWSHKFEKSKYLIILH